MKTDEQRTEEILGRVRQIKAEKKNRKFRAAAASSLTLCVCIIVAAGIFFKDNVSNITNNVTVSTSGSASIMIDSEALGLVVVGLLGFLLGASFTVFLFLLKKRMRAEVKQDDKF